MACFRLGILLILRHASILTRFSLLLDSWAYQNPFDLRRITDVLHFHEWVWTGLILERGGGFQLLNQLIDLILPSEFLVLLIGQQQGRGDVGRTLSVRMMNEEASRSGLLVDTLSRCTLGTLNLCER
ncbi:hypothetical protein LguiA_033757 [Lonicera macranthoides]